MGKKKAIISKEDKFLQDAKITNMRPLNAGTGYAAGMVVKRYPNITHKEAWGMINKKLCAGMNEADAIEEVIANLKRNKGKK